MGKTAFKKAKCILMVFLFLSVGYGTACGPGKETPDANPGAWTLTVTALDVGKADAFVLCSAHHVTVIDTATDKQGRALVAFLTEQGIDTIDELIITHFDKDHVGGADRVIDNFRVKKIYTSYPHKESDDTEEFFTSMEEKELKNEVVTEEFSYEADGVTYTVYPPKKEEYQKKESNNTSLAIRVSVGEKSMLFTGDAEEERLEELLDTEGIRSDVLKMPHHGRDKDNLRQFLACIAPEAAIITSSDKEPEDEAVMELLDVLGVRTYLTRDGDITVFLAEDDMKIVQE